MSEFYTTRNCKVPTPQIIVGLRQEWQLRKNTYPDWVQQGRMTEEQARHGILVMESAYYMVCAVNELHEASREMWTLDQRKQTTEG